jgi:hypothetical protein
MRSPSPVRPLTSMRVASLSLPGICAGHAVSACAPRADERLAAYAETMRSQPESGGLGSRSRTPARSTAGRGRSPRTRAPAARTRAAHSYKSDTARRPPAPRPPISGQAPRSGRYEHSRRATTRRPESSDYYSGLSSFLWQARPCNRGQLSWPRSALDSGCHARFPPESRAF